MQTLPRSESASIASQKSIGFAMGAPVTSRSGGAILVGCLPVCVLRRF